MSLRVIYSALSVKTTPVPEKRHKTGSYLNRRSKSGSDIFTFCGDWGNDVVEQLDGGTVTLWFTSDSEDRVVWDEISRSCTDGENSVTVKGVAPVTLKFGGTGDDAAMFAALSEAGAFEGVTSHKIFEESKGLLA